MELTDAALTFATSMSSNGVTYAADWTIETTQVMHVDAVEPLTIADLHRRFAQPLLALTTFISDRLDSLSREHVRDEEGQRSAEFWRCGREVAVRPCRGSG